MGLLVPEAGARYAFTSCIVFNKDVIRLLPSARMRSEGTVVTLGARMRSEGTVVGSVCLSVSLYLTPRTSVRPRNDTIYPTGDEGQNFRTVLSETAPLQN